MGGVVYDTGALIAAERGAERLLALHDRLTLRGERPLVPVVVLAQAWRGGPQPRMSRLLSGCSVLPDDEGVGKAAGVACARAGSRDVVDAIVVVTALARGAAVVTSDPTDLRGIADALGAELPLFRV